MLAAVRHLKTYGRRMMVHGRNYWNRSDFLMLHIKDHGDWRMNWAEAKMAHDSKGIILEQLVLLSY